MAPRPVYLVHADGSLPNIALMRMSTYFKSIGRSVTLLRGGAIWDSERHPDGDVYGSSIFLFSDSIRTKIESTWGHVRWGGTGVRVDSSLSEIDSSVDWDSVQLDYSLYPGFEPSIGFLSRGCRLRCGFCVVPAKEGKPRAVAGVRDIWRGGGHPKHLHLLDNDAFAPQLRNHWRDAIEEMISGNFRVCFSQGLNVRLIDDESASMIARIRYTGHSFDKRRLFTAWDSLGDESIFRRGVATLAKAGVPAKHLRVYMLVGYDPKETWETIFYRHAELVALGCEPFPMVYDRSRPELRAFARWGGAARVPLYKVTPWTNYAVDGREDTRLTDETRAVSNAAYQRVLGGWKPIRRLQVSS